MIHVEPAPEPRNFDQQVRQPGVNALAARQARVDAGEKPGKLPDYWRRCIPDLLAAYQRVCAYSCFFIHRVTGSRTVEHRAPKVSHPEMAYEWANYRLVCGLMNSRKREFEDVLDPFAIEDGWFRLEFLGFTVTPSPELEPERQAQVAATIERLRLNDGDCRDTRAENFTDYLNGGLDWHQLVKYSPFVAKEVERQGRRRPND